MPAEPVAWAAWLGLAAVAAVCVLRALRQERGVLALALLFAPLLPVAGASLLEAGVRFAERSLALPAVGSALAIASLASRAPARLRTAGSISGEQRRSAGPST